MSRKQEFVSMLVEFFEASQFDRSVKCGQWERRLRPDNGFFNWNPSGESVPQFGVSVPGSFGVDFWIKEPAFAVELPLGLSYLNGLGAVIEDPRKYGYPDWTHKFYQPTAYWGPTLPWWTEQRVGGFIIREDSRTDSPVVMRGSLTPLAQKGILFEMDDDGTLTLSGDALANILTPHGKALLGETTTTMSCKLYGLHLMDKNRGGNFDGLFALRSDRTSVRITELEDVQ